MDKPLLGFLEHQYREAMAFAAESDLLDLEPLPGSPPSRYLAHFTCTGLVHAGSDIVEWNHFVVGIWFPSVYLRRVNPVQVVSWLAPNEIWHPNIGGSPRPHICLGTIRPGSSLVDLLIQCWELITYHQCTMDENDALNWDACRWARHNTHRFPVDKRPLKRRALEIDLVPIGPLVAKGAAAEGPAVPGE
jgi:hypothetical protein